MRLDLIFDTHALLWMVVSDAKLSDRVRSALADLDTRLFVSAITAWEYGDLHRRGRLPGSVSFESIQTDLGLQLLDFPASAWRRSQSLPMIHRDPIDRMLIAHAMEAELTLVTADRRMQSYPVATLW